ncbi:MAG: hypothetical protein CVU72_07140, partial [Deltaproteobacteria bacterium HGW-Deltaproteobacteria-7]
MGSRIEVSFNETTRDALGEAVRKRIAEDLNLGVDSVRTIDVYTFERPLPDEQLRILGGQVFADPIIQVYSGKPLARDFSWLIEVGFRPGVTDNVGGTAKKAASDVLKTDIKAVFFSRQYLIKGDITRSDAELIAILISSGTKEDSAIDLSRKILQLGDNN